MYRKLITAKKDQEGEDRAGSGSDLISIQFIVSLRRLEKLLYAEIFQRPDLWSFHWWCYSQPALNVREPLSMISARQFASSLLYWSRSEVQSIHSIGHGLVTEVCSIPRSSCSYIMCELSLSPMWAVRWDVIICSQGRATRLKHPCGGRWLVDV